MRIRLDKKLNLSEIAAALTAKIPRSDSTEISHIVTDSRKAMPGDLFFALDGERFCGEDFVSEAISRGAFAVSKKIGSGILTVDSPSESLLKTASLYKEKLSELKSTIAITGSVGKTTTKEFLSLILSAKYRVHKTRENQNNNIGLPYTIFSAPQNTEVLVLEMGMNHSGEISELSKTARPDFGIITNVGSAHIGNLGSRENIAKAKLEILDGMEKPIVAVPDEESLLWDFRGRIGVSNANPDADICITVTEESIHGTHFNYRSRLHEIKDIFLKIPGRHLVDCLSLAICAGEIMMLTPSELIYGVSQINNDILRQKYIKLHNFTIFDDTYNSSPEAVKAVISAVREARGDRFSLVLGDMLELGEHTERLHWEVGELVAKSGAARLYTVGPLAEEIANAALISGMSRDAVFRNPDIGHPEKTAEQILKDNHEKEVIIFKGSHAARLDKIIDVLRERKGV